ncbi:MAG: glutamine--fructose-6-phosphate transaminase (isomerizing) [Solitalea-like symbiont of Tyrophagus putrescentiae]
MCGIIAYIGNKSAYPILIDGLKRLEYRGYDSAGIAVVNEKDKKIRIFKKRGKVLNLENFTEDNDLQDYNVGIGHTRWATHGEPSDENAHPHTSNNGQIALIHNGIIENYQSIKKSLIKKGYSFVSETDTEVLGIFIADIQKELKLSIEEAVRIALTKVIGAYAIAVVDATSPNKIVVARKGSPLLIGVGDNENIIASDISAVVKHTKNVIYLKDEEMAIVTDSNIVVKNLCNEDQPTYIKKIEIDLRAIEKGDYEHFMLKEIMEQPQTVADSMRGRLNFSNYNITLGGLRDNMDDFKRARRIILLACGTSWHAGLVAKYFFEEYGKIPTNLEYASEFKYRDTIIYPDDIVIAISQSGETADTIVAVEKAKKAGATVLGICNVTGSSLSRITDAGVYTHAGIEIGVASTKAFTSQLVVLYLIGTAIARARHTIDIDKYNMLSKSISETPKQIQEILNTASSIQKIAEKYYKASSMLYLGRGYNFPIALEGALKLKEISYIHAEGYPAAEMKHGPIALIDKNIPVVFLATKDNLYKKTLSNIEETKARGAKIIAIATKGDTGLGDLVSDIIEVPEVKESSLYSLLNIVPLQLFAYYIAVKKGTNVDQPRNLAKSVTVE